MFICPASSRLHLPYLTYLTLPVSSRFEFSTMYLVYGVWGGAGQAKSPIENGDSWDLDCHIETLWRERQGIKHLC